LQKSPPRQIIKKLNLPEDGEPKYEQRRFEENDKNWMRKTRKWIERNASAETKIIKSLKAEEREEPKSAFAMLAELWKTTPSDCRAALIGEFLFDPAAFRNRYFQEQYFRESLKNRWSK
jgi:hypothetical protein